MIELFHLLKPARSQWGWMAGGIVMGVVVIGANSLLMAVSGWFIASMAVAGATKVSFNYFTPSAAIRTLAIIRTTGRYAERLITHSAALRIVTTLRTWLFNRLEPLAPALLDRYSSGDLSGRLRRDIDSLENVYLRIIAPLCTGALAIILASLFVAIWCWQAAVALLLCLAVTGVLLPIVARSLAAPPGKMATELAGKLRTDALDGINGGVELILLGAVERNVELVTGISKKLVSQQKKLAEISGVSAAGGAISAGIGLAAVLAAASVSCGHQEISGPQLVMLLLFSAAAFEAAGGMPAALQLLPETSQSAMRVTELSGSSWPVPDPVERLPLPADFTVKLENVSLSYKPGSGVLSGFNLEIPMGGRVAIAGQSGSGKSSIVNLLLRFRDYDGSVTIGGVDFKKLAADDLRTMISAAPQNPHLFNGTIRENLLLANPGASEECINRALFVSALDEWLRELPEGLETRVGAQGWGVSGGQLRRIALARAIVKNAPLLILDEPTEGLDDATGKKFLTRLDGHLKESGRSLLIISHREQCLSIVDKILRMK